LTRTIIVLPTPINNFVNPAAAVTITDGKMENLKYSVLRQEYREAAI